MHNHIDAINKQFMLAPVESIMKFGCKGCYASKAFGTSLCCGPLVEYGMPFDAYECAYSDGMIRADCPIMS